MILGSMVRDSEKVSKQRYVVYYFEHARFFFSCGEYEE